MCAQAAWACVTSHYAPGPMQGHAADTEAGEIGRRRDTEPQGGLGGPGGEVCSWSCLNSRVA